MCFGLYRDASKIGMTSVCFVENIEEKFTKLCFSFKHWLFFLRRLQKFKLMTANTVISSENASMTSMGTEQVCINITTAVVTILCIIA